jgi:trehalose-6-phosphate synthase
MDNVLPPQVISFLYVVNKAYKNLAEAMVKAIEQVPKNREKFRNNCIKSVADQNLEEFCSKYVDLFKVLK